MNRSFTEDRVVGRVIDPANIHALLAGTAKVSRDHLSALRTYLAHLPRRQPKIPTEIDRTLVMLGLVAYMDRTGAKDQRLATEMTRLLPGKPPVDYKTIGRFLAPVRLKRSKAQPAKLAKIPRTVDETVILFQEFLSIVEAARLQSRDGFIEALGERLSAAYNAIPFDRTVTIEVSTDHSKGSFSTQPDTTYSPITEKLDGAIYDGVVVRVREGFAGVLRDRQFFRPRSFMLTETTRSQEAYKGSGCSFPFLRAPESFSIRAERQ